MKDPWICGTCGKKFRGLSLFDSHRKTFNPHCDNDHPHYGRLCRNSYHLALLGWRYIDGVWYGPEIPEDKQWWKHVDRNPDNDDKRETGGGDPVPPP